MSAAEPLTARYRIQVEGTVQGVGFRPFVYRVARGLGLRGSVRNTAAGVVIDAEGAGAALDGLLHALGHESPPLARIDRIHWVSLTPLGFGEFTIETSQGGESVRVLVPPDVAICADCAADIRDRRDRRFGYPFTNCTNCGPRFTIVRDLPYDRSRTVMAAFPMCGECSAEYHNPADRRFHAQPVACPHCGPQAWYEDRAETRRADWVTAFREAVSAGQVVAVKGLGGFHLAVDAHREEAVARLRERKHRPRRPFAVMARDLATVRRYCFVSEAEERLLASPAAPIVLLTRREAPYGARPLAAGLAPAMATLGVMLPYTPLHMLLFDGWDEGPDLLVMTSGNRSALPIVKDNGAARQELGDIADGFLLHDRDIENRADDSVVRILDGQVHFLRRSRGYVPAPFRVPVPRTDHPVVMGAGGDMKNASCLIKEGQAYMGPHGGAMETLEGIELFHHNLQTMVRILGTREQLVGVDLHPSYWVSDEMRRLHAWPEEVQHHHAHLAAVMAEHGRTAPTLGLILDGTGYGTDGKLWGGELLLGDLTGFRRLAHFRYVPLPGGERAIHHPWLTAVACLWLELGHDEAVAVAKQLFPGRDRELEVALLLLKAGLNTPESAGAGRLFDAVSAVAGLCPDSTYEGQAAVELGECLREPFDLPGSEPDYPYRLTEAGSPSGPATLDLLPAVAAAARDRLAGVDAAVIATRWHRTFAHAVAAMARAGAEAAGITTVGLSGGVFHNPYLTFAVPRLLKQDGLEALVHRQVPPGDGGLALGQAAVALWRRA